MPVPLNALLALAIGAAAGCLLAFTLDHAYGSARHFVHPPRRRLALLAISGAAATTLAVGVTSSVAEAAATATIAFIFLALAATDFERHLLPNRLIYPAIPLALVLAPGLPAGTHLASALGAALGFFVMLVPFLASPRALGAGDVKLAALVGAFVGARLLVTALTLGAFVGALICLIILVRGHQRGRTRIAYGPYLALGALLVPLLY